MRYITLELNLWKGSGDGEDGPLTLKDFKYIGGRRLAEFFNNLDLVGDCQIVPEGVPDEVTGSWGCTPVTDQLYWQNDDTREVIDVNEDTPLEYD